MAETIGKAGSSGSEKRLEGKHCSAPFPSHVRSDLRALHASGMVGTGQQYSALIRLACSKTGLSDGQVKVCHLAVIIIIWKLIARCIFIHRTGSKDRT